MPQKRIAPRVAGACFLTGMWLTIELDDQRRFETGEIGDVRMQRVLEAELVSAELAVAEALPDAVLGFGPVTAEGCGPVK